MKTTQHASNGETTSLADASVAHEAIQNRHMRLIKVGTDDQMADVLTKALPFPAFMQCVEGVMRGAMAPKGP
jgi:hypothetical protein